MRSTIRPTRRRTIAVIGLGALTVAGVATLASLAAPAPHPSVPAPPARPSPPPPTSAPPAPVPPVPSLQGWTLRGVTATGAIVEPSSGVQRLVALGRELLPGLRLEAVRRDHILLVGPSGTVELRFPDSPGGAAAPTAPAPRVADAAEARREETLGYRFGLAPRRQDGRITGFALREGVDMPVLRRAGMRPGDVLIAVNGKSFDSAERLFELAEEVAGAFTAEFVFEREGRRMEASLEVNERPQT